MRWALCYDLWSFRCPVLLQGRRRPGRVEALSEAGEEGRSSRGRVRLCCVLCPALLQRRPFEVRAEASEERENSRGVVRLWRSDLSSSFWSDDSFVRRSEEEEAQMEEEEQGPMSRKHMHDEKRGVRLMEVVASLVEKLLIADFFFILFILAWFVAGLAEKAAFDTSSIIDAWLPLWPRLFQPALGFFMAGSMWTALSKIWRKR